MMEASKQEIMLDVSELRKFFPIQKGFMRRVVGQVRAVDDVSFSIRKGELLSLVGESGCGKTTTARCIMRAYQPTSGQIQVRTRKGNMVDISAMSKRDLRAFRPEIQMIFQDPVSSLNPRMTVHDIIAEGLEVNGMGNRNERTDHVAQAMKLVGLRPEYMRRFPHAFSGGERQRIGIARALVLNPNLIVADEPVSALDVSVQAQNSQPAPGAADTARSDHAVYRSRPQRRQTHQQPGGRHVRWADCRNGRDAAAVSKSAPPLHRGAAFLRPKKRPPPASQPRHP